MSDLERNQSKNENMEHQIESMLEKVMKEDNDEEMIENQSLYEMLTTQCDNEMLSFMKEENTRAGRKCLSSKPPIMTHPAMMKMSGNIQLDIKRLEELEKINRKSKTVTYVDNAPNNRQNDTVFNQHLYEQNQFYQNFNNSILNLSMLSLNGSPNKKDLFPNIELSLDEFENRRNRSNSGNMKLEIENDLFLEEVFKGRERIDEECLTKISGQLYKILTTQNGSRIIQKYLKKSSQEVLSLLLDEILPKTTELIVDPYANYFCQKFFTMLASEDRIKLLKQISGFIAQIGKSKIGTYPLQSFIEQLNTFREKMVVLEAIKDEILNLCLDSQGVHVVEKVIISFEENMIFYIYEIIIKNFMMLVNNCNGLCVIKKIIIHTSNETYLNRIVKILVDNCMNLIQNPFGNYAIQVALDHWKDEHIFPVINMFVNKFGNLSMQKYSSNVIEKCLERGGDWIVNSFIDEITINNRVVDLMKNNYGNYVVQKSLKLSSGMFKGKLMNSILKNLNKLGDRKLIVKWRSIVDANVEGTGFQSRMNQDMGNYNQYSNNAIYRNVFTTNDKLSDPRQINMNNQFYLTNNQAGNQYLNQTLHSPNMRYTHQMNSMPLMNINRNSSFINNYPQPIENSSFNYLIQYDVSNDFQPNIRRKHKSKTNQPSINCNFNPQQNNNTVNPYDNISDTYKTSRRDKMNK